MDSSQEIIPVVNEQDEIICYKPRSEITTNDIYRATGCRVRDPAWNILLAQRAFTKKHNPGKRACAVAGTVQKWETYLANVLKEILEEIGIAVIEKDLSLGPKIYREYDRKYFWQRFILEYDWPKEDLKFERGAMEALKRLSSEELKKDYISDPEKYTHGMGRCIENFL